MPFADVASGDARVAEPLSERGQAEVRREVVGQHAVAVRIKAREDRGARGTAHRRACGCVLEAHAGRCQPIDVRRAQCQRGLVAADAICALSVDQEEDGLAFGHGESGMPALAPRPTCARRKSEGVTPLMRLNSRQK